ncbi:hypothetical protein [Streptosporangium sp. NPDC048865]|uniref:hypothetical protein n=1 Tax=Streptosporangium sp. NPDC048865 TaxID=3155766 RepID=UPI00343A4C2C
MQAADLRLLARLGLMMCSLTAPHHQLARRVGRPGPVAAFERTPVTLSSVADRIGVTRVRERRVRAYSIERDAYA